MNQKDILVEAFIKNLNEANENQGLNGFDFIPGYPEFKELKNEYFEYKKLADKDSFMTQKSGGTYQNNDFDNNLESKRKSLSDKCIEIFKRNKAYIAIFDNSKEQILFNINSNNIEEIKGHYRETLDEGDIDFGRDINSIESFEDWFERTSNPSLGRNPRYIQL